MNPQSAATRDGGGELDGKLAVVVGASRGLGRGVAEALSSAGASVLAIARDQAGLETLRAEHPSVEVLQADAMDPVVAGSVIDSREPDIVAVVAGASPLLHSIHHHTWETFSQNWNVDVRASFNWVREALLKPLRPGSRILLMSSGAALHGSPITGGYAGAKATIRFIAEYADEEARRNELGIRVLAIMPRLTPATELGLSSIRAYAAREGVSEEDYRATLGSPVTPGVAGAAVCQLVATDVEEAVLYRVSGDEGVVALPASA